MEKTKLLKVVVVVLIMLNAATLGFLLTRHHPPHKVMPREIIIRKLHFDARQQQQYDELIKGHRSTITRLEGQMHTAKTQLYLQLLRNEPDNKAKDSLINVVANCQNQIENTHFNHFEAIKNLCHKDQLRDFYALTEELAEIFSKPPPPKHHE